MTKTGQEQFGAAHDARSIAVIGLVATVIVILLGGTLGYFNARRLVHYNERVDHTHQVIGALTTLLSTLKDAETGQRGYLFTEDESYLQPYNEAVKLVPSELAQLKNLTQDDPTQRSYFDTVAQTTTAKLAELQQTVALMKQIDRDGARRLVRSNLGRALMDQLRASIRTMEDREEEQLRTRVAEAEASYRTLIALILLTGVVEAVLITGIFLFSRQNLRLQERAADAIAEERERLRTTLTSIGDAVIATDLDGRVALMNRVAESLTGWPEHSAAGQKLDVVFHIVNERTREPAPSPVIKALSEGVVIGLANHTVLVAKDGTERPIDDSAAPIRSRDGHIIGCVLVFRDITERRQMEREHSERFSSARLLSTIVENSNDAIISKTLDGIVVSWNASAERLLGYTEAEAVGRHISFIIPPDRLFEEEEIIKRLRAGERVEHFDTRRQRSDGELIDVSLTISPLRDEAGRIVGASKIMRDVTERKRAEQRINALMTELKEADRHKDEFLAMLGHELRNPLSAVSNAIVTASEEPSRSARALEIARRQIERLTRLIDDLLDVARITQGRISLRKLPVDLADTIERAIESTRELVAAQGLQLTRSAMPAPLTLVADPERLEQVFVNLLSNAAKYTPGGGKIDIVAERHGGEITVRVRDTGIGIAPEMLPKIWDLFTQVQPGPARTQGGLGIGLTVVRRLVELHGGHVEARSAGLGKGAEFVVTLPVSPLPAGEEAPQTPADPAPEPRARVIVVEDNTDAAQSLMMLLELRGHHVRIASDGMAALEAARTRVPDVMLVDIGLPGIDGYELARRVRSDPRLSGIGLIALTGYGLEADQQQALAAGFDHHLVKPVDPQMLYQLVAGFGSADGNLSRPA